MRHFSVPFKLGLSGSESVPLPRVPPFFIRADGYLSCRIVIKGIKADSNHFMRIYSAKR